jgi:hypothetical protein
MKKSYPHCILTAAAIALMVAAGGAEGWAQSQNSPSNDTAGLQQRIDFGNSYIMGQSIKSGAVYLLHRKQSEINSMLEYRQDYRQEILEDFKIQDSNVRVPRANDRNALVSQ